jgi:hypothetical protein
MSPSVAMGASRPQVFAPSHMACLLLRVVGSLHGFRARDPPSLGPLARRATPHNIHPLRRDEAAAPTILHAIAAARNELAQPTSSWTSRMGVGGWLRPTTHRAHLEFPCSHRHSRARLSAISSPHTSLAAHTLSDQHMFRLPANAACLLLAHAVMQSADGARTKTHTPALQAPTRLARHAHGV